MAVSLIFWIGLIYILGATAGEENSDKSVDQCGQCAGENNTCRIVSGLYTRPILPVGYNLIAQIPRGACNINITELKQSRNYLALRTPNTQYILNGNWAINWSGEYEGAGVKFIYRRHDPRYSQGEQIWTRGPITDTVDVLIIYQHPNPGVRYEYSLPVKHSVGLSSPWKNPEIHPKLIEEGVPPTRRKHRHHHGYLEDGTRHSERRHHDHGTSKRGEYRWAVTGYTQCSQTCNGGLQKNIVVCMKKKSLAIVSDELCDSEPKPPVQAVKCNTQPCTNTIWVSDEWSLCSTTCGPGVQTRLVNCKQEIGSGISVTVTEAACYGLERPPATQVCNSRYCVQWKIGQWSKCSTECGRGLRTREVFCTTENGPMVPEVECGTNKPETDQICDMGSCTHTWYFSPWTETCSKECGDSVQTRKVFCFPDTEGPNKTFGCDPKRKPATEKACPQIQKKCGSRWFSGSWSQCSVSCGSGVRTRDVVCIKASPEGKIDLNSGQAECPKETKPPTHKACTIKHCEPEWLTSEFSECSKSCGTGVQTREVACVGHDNKPSADCSEESRPMSRQSCNTQDCPSVKRDPRCLDKYGNCPLVVRARLCSYTYYRDLCCDSCSNK